MPLNRNEIGIGLLAVFLVLTWYASKDLCRGHDGPYRICDVVYGSKLPSPSSTKGSR